jgi:hypothetical protein
VIKQIDGLTYCNDGDWVESCTALVEHTDGRLEIIHWADLRGLVPVGATGPGQPASLPQSVKAVSCASSSSPTPGIPRSTALSVP